MHLLDHEVITNLWLLARVIAKTLAYTGLGLGVVLAWGACLLYERREIASVSDGIAKKPAGSERATRTKRAA
jgi:hypothetical protein